MENFKEWLLTSVAKAWEQVRLDNDAGHIWNEQDTISAFYAAFRPLVELRNSTRNGGVAKLRLLSELMTIHRNTKSKRPLDLALVELSLSEPHIPEKILCQFEFKYYYVYYWSYIEGMICSEVERFVDGNRDRYIETWVGDDVVFRFDATTKNIFFGLISTNWEYGLRGISDNPLNNKILHPNGMYIHHNFENEEKPPRISDHNGFNYYEMHGPITYSRVSEKEKWSLFKVREDGSSIKQNFDF